MCDIIGYSKGEKCNRNGCNGVIEEYESDGGCSCHINPPCSYCTNSREYCSECGWDGISGQIDESKHKNYAVFDLITLLKPRTMYDLNKDEIDWLNFDHTHFSMRKNGVFPKGTTKKDVERKVIGSFGGRFNYFNEVDCTFEYIAYTD